ncbi:MAG: 4-hydroxy-tetrahydrodipicolinate reductase [Kiritimatiellae bacterium]|nr:4-hydroxy-tetrahydrodipicolinate reductase [Kiritimatiellia bacterium]
MTTICILGAAGRMGQALLRAATAFSDLRVTAAVEQEGHEALGQDAGLRAAAAKLGVPITTADRAAAADVTIDFTFHTATPANAARAAVGKGYVLGTTGLTSEERQAVQELARRIPVVWAPNMSLGVNLLLDLARRAAAVLDAAYDVEIVEMHHRLKRDAPSGTALGLAEAVARGRSVSLEDVACYGRHGVTGERPRGQIALHALRGGDVVGDHTVIFAADGERIELAHKASNRDAFAKGALHAAHWLHGRPAGLYSMRHVLGLE